MASCSQAQRRLKSHFVGDHEVEADDVAVERRYA
jgi:hypothetical protein